MKNKLTLKIVVIALLTLLLLIPLCMIGGKVDERKRYNDSVQYEISNIWTGKQMLRGPILVVPFSEKIKTEVWDKKLEKHVEKIKEEYKRLYFFPEKLDLETIVQTEERSRGIYNVPVYTANVKMQGNFTIPANYSVSRSRNITWHRAFLVVGLSDMRGIRAETALTWQGKKTKFAPGTQIRQFKNGAHAKINNLYSPDKQDYTFDIQLQVAGTKDLSILPVGKVTNVKMSSQWQHPSFTGRFLPSTRTVSESGFDAEWQVSHFATDIENAFKRCNSSNCNEFEANHFGVSFIKPISVYKLTDRSIKYGILFIVLTFCVFFLFEIMKKLAIHPIQYGLVGLALAVFYLLLLALSEHMFFDIAYLISAISSAALITFYISYVLNSAMRGVSLGAALFGLYLMLLVILKSEDYALLMGSLLVFTTLAAFMLLTRRVDWYQVNERAMKISSKAD